ncbi:MAG: SBBP repeat-containing protein [Terriglobia bacterium]
MPSSALVILRRVWVLSISLILFIVLQVKDDASRVLVAAEPVVHARIARAELLLSFEPNLGQTDPRVKFLARASGYTLFLTKDEAVIAMQKPVVRNRKSEEERRHLSAVRGQLHQTRKGDRSAFLVTPHSTTPFPVPSAQIPSFFCLKLLHANPAVKVTPANELPGKRNYLVGNDPKKWRTNVPTYGSVRYENIYPGVDLVYYRKQNGQLEYDFVVAPGADSRLITLAVASDRQWEGSRQKAAGSGEPSEVSRSPRAESVAVNHGPRVTNSAQFKIQKRKSKIPSPLRILTNGDLIVNTTGGDVRFHKPVVYQEQSTVNSAQLAAARDGTLEPAHSDNGPGAATHPKSEIQNPKLVDAHYVLKPDGEVTFEIAPYDRTLPLIIDPVLSYSTYLGGNDMDYANGIAVDASGNAYVTGYTASTNFPLVDPVQSSPRWRHLLRWCGRDRLLRRLRNETEPHRDRIGIFHLPGGGQQ